MSTRLLLALLLWLGTSLSTAAPATEPTSPTNTRSNGLTTLLQKTAWIAEVQVVALHARKGTMGRAKTPAIWTDVRFRRLSWLLQPIGTRVAEEFTLSFIGGQLGRKGMFVSHVPRFRKGDHLVLLAAPGQKGCPLVGCAHGVFSVRNGRLYTEHGWALSKVTKQGFVLLPTRARSPYKANFIQPQGNAKGRQVQPPTARGMTLEAFRQALQEWKNNPSPTRGGKQ